MFESKRLPIDRLKQPIGNISKQIAVRTRSSQEQYQLISVYLIHEQPIRLNVTFSIPAVIAGKRMITIFCFKCFAVRKSRNHLLDFIEVITALLRKF